MKSILAEQEQASRGRPTYAAGAGSGELPGTWLAFIRYCREIGHGEIERLRIQDGLPVLAEVTKKKVKFTP